MPPARRVALGIRVRVRDPGCGLVLAGGRAVAFHPNVGPRLPRHDRDLWIVARAAVLVRAAGAPALPVRAVRARIPHRLDRGRMGGRSSGRYPVSLARPRLVIGRRTRAGAVGRRGGCARSDPLAGVVQCHAGSGVLAVGVQGARQRFGSVATADRGARDGARGLGLRRLAYPHAAAARAGHGRAGSAERGLPRKVGSRPRR